MSTVPETAQPDPAAPPARRRVVVVGGGFGGLKTVSALRRTDVDITLVDRRNHHLFQPLLYQVATAALSPAQIAQPIRGILKRQDNVRVVLDEVTGVDTRRRQVLTRSGTELAYDDLVLATGASHAYFGHDEWQESAPGLKSLDDATALRRRILDAFERAELCEQPEERSALLTFCVVGGGPTGVEMAGAIAELAHRTLVSEFHRIDTRSARVLLIEAGPRILAAMPPSLSAKAQRGLERLGVSVLVNTAVTDCSTRGVRLGAQSLACRTIVWAAGVRASPVGSWLGPEVRLDRAGRVKVAADLSVPGLPGVYVIGDAAAVTMADGRLVPGVAPAAKQQGRYVAALIQRRVRGLAAPGPFVYVDQGNLATVGRGEAVCDLGRIRLSGIPAWLFWCLIHVFFLIDFRNRVSVALDWIWSFVTDGRSARLITEGERSQNP